MGGLLLLRPRCRGKCLTNMSVNKDICETTSYTFVNITERAGAQLLPLSFDILLTGHIHLKDRNLKGMYRPHKG
jgi:hypothetical protein